MPCCVEGEEPEEGAPRRLTGGEWMANEAVRRAVVKAKKEAENRPALTREGRMDVTLDGPPALPEVVSRYLAGESMSVLAAETKKSRRTLYHWILTEVGGEKFREMVTEVMTARIADADEALEEARLKGDPVLVSACREACRFYRMDLERRRPNLYGQKQDTGGQVVVVQVANLRGSE